MRRPAADWALRIAAAASLLLALASSPRAQQDSLVKGTAALSLEPGFARLVVKLDADVESEVTTRGNVLVMRFKRPVAVPTGGLEMAAPGYVSAVRSDPDRMSLRFALDRPVTLNTMVAGERVFVDLLPADWKGPPPGLPQEIVRELAERARAAERLLRQQAGAAAARRARMRVRVAEQPAFTRLVFETPNGVTGTATLNGRTLTASFDAALQVDLADAKSAAPSLLAGITHRDTAGATSVEVALLNDVELRAFHDDGGFFVDLVKLPNDPVSRVEREAAKIAPPVAQAVKSPAPVPAGDVVAASAATIAQIIQARTPTQPEAASAASVGTEGAPGQDRDAGRATLQTKRTPENLSVQFGVASSVPAALFRRADSIWVVLDRPAPIDPVPIRRQGEGIIADVSVFPLGNAQAMRLRLRRPLMASLIASGDGWILALANAATAQPQALEARRNLTDPSRASVTVPLPGVGRLHTLTDPDSGAVLQVVTAAAPGRGILRRQDFVEFALLESTHGLVAQTYADDVKIDVALDRVVFGRPGGLTLSAAETGAKRGSAPMRALFDARQWEQDSKGPFRERLDELTSALRLAPEQGRTAQRAALARFYIARGLYPEAKAVLDGAIAAEGTEQPDPSLILLHAVSTVLMNRADLAEKDLTNSAFGGGFDLELWKAMVLAGQAKWPQAREKFKNAGSAINALPVDLQRLVLLRAIKASLQASDVGDAAARMDELELIGISDDHAAPAAVLRGRIALAMGHEADALAAFQGAARSANRPAAVEARLEEIALRLKGNEPTETDALRDLETLAVTWRGDDSEIKALQMLARAYAKTSRYGDAFAATRAATLLQPNSDVSRKLQDDAADLFGEIFLTPKGDSIPPIEALGMFYENRDLTPIGRRGDELIRRLAERLVAVDLLEQACELLQYQVDHRLEGQARTQVAARLATIYLMERKPDRALGALHSTRIADAGGDVRQQRLLLEARAQSDIGRRDLALDIIANVPGREAMRLRSDIHWAARRWSEAAEQIELYLGERWRDFAPLTPQDRSDVLRASIGYVLSGDTLGLGRFRDKFASLMTGTPEQGAFDTVTRMAEASGADLAKIAQLAAGVDTLDGFLRDMKTRFIDNAKPRQMSDATRR